MERAKLLRNTEANDLILKLFVFILNLLPRLLFNLRSLEKLKTGGLAIHCSTALCIRHR